MRYTMQSPIYNRHLSYANTCTRINILPFPLVAGRFLSISKVDTVAKEEMNMADWFAESCFYV